MSLRRISKFSPKPTGAGLVNLKPTLRMADGGEGLSTADRIARTRQATYQTKQGDPVVMSQGLPNAYPSNTDLFMNSVDRGLTSVGNGLRGMVGAAPRQAPDIQAQAMAVNKMFAPIEPTPRQPVQPMQPAEPIRFNDGGGGSVPGRGEGDKVPALYEPGEFVVSNDMLDAAPSLRGELRSLRKAVLAEKGMTPEEADDKAVSGGSLRANGGYDGGRWGQQTELDRAQRARAVGGPVAPLPDMTSHDARVPSGLGNISPGATPVGPAAPVPAPAPSEPQAPSLRMQDGKQVGTTSAYRFDVAGKSPLYTDAASLPSAERMLSRPAMSASDPGMQGIQARQDARMQSLGQQAQLSQEVAAADKVNEAGRRMNLEYTARRGNRQDARTLSTMDAMAAADKSNAVTLRGQDMKLQGEMYQTDGAARSAAAKGKYESLRDERAYRDGRTDKTFEQRQSARKAMDERIASKFVDKEGKPDLARAADYKDSVSTTLAALAAEARAKGDTAKADRLAAADYSNMDSEDEAMIQQLFDAKQAARTNASWYNGKFVDDRNLLSYRPEGIRKNTLMSNNVRTQNGTELNMNDARDQGIFGGPGSSSLDPYLAQAQQLEAQRLRTQGR